MKKIKTSFLTIATLFSGLYMYGQAKDASVMIDGENRNAVTINIDQPEKLTSEALHQRMERSGLKNKMKNGVTSYKGVVLSEISPDKVDIYTKVEKGPNNGSIVYMAVSRGYNNFTKDATDSTINQNVKKFLEAFVQDADFHSANVGIGNQITQVNIDEKMYRRLLNEQDDLQKQKVVIDNKLLEIQNELNIREASIGKKKAGIEDSKVKRAAITTQ